MLLNERAKGHGLSQRMGDMETKATVERPGEAAIGIATLNELAGFLQKTLPDAACLSQLEIRASVDFVVFRWHQVQFLARRTLEVFELRGNRLFITNLSFLLQVILLRRKHEMDLLADAVETLGRAETLMCLGSGASTGIKLVDVVKHSLGKRYESVRHTPHQLYSTVSDRPKERRGPHRPELDNEWERFSALLTV